MAPYGWGDEGQFRFGAVQFWAIFVTFLNIQRFGQVRSAQAQSNQIIKSTPVQSSVHHEKLKKTKFASHSKADWPATQNKNLIKLDKDPRLAVSEQLFEPCREQRDAIFIESSSSSLTSNRHLKNITLCNSAAR